MLPPFVPEALILALTIPTFSPKILIVPPAASIAPEAIATPGSGGTFISAAVRVIVPSGLTRTPLAGATRPPVSNSGRDGGFKRELSATTPLPDTPGSISKLRRCPA